MHLYHSTLTYKWDVLWFAVHMIVATPGRILDLMNKELVKTDACKVLVLDEVSGRFFTATALLC